MILVLGPKRTQRITGNVSNFPSSIGKSTLHFQKANNGAYLSPDKQMQALNKDFGAVWQTDLTSV